jgi:hypothetical protein
MSTGGYNLGEGRDRSEGHTSSIGAACGVVEGPSVMRDPCVEPSSETGVWEPAGVVALRDASESVMREIVSGSPDLRHGRRRVAGTTPAQCLSCIS